MTGETTLMVALVHATDGVRFVAAGQHADQVADSLVDYLRPRCNDALSPAEALRVLALIEAGDTYTAIGEYFGHVGSRWDEERLEIHVVGRGYDLVWERLEPMQRAS